MRLNLVVKENKKQNKKIKSGGTEEGANKCSILWCMESRFIRTNVSEI